MAMATTSSSLVDRMVRAARLEPALYDEVDADTGATSQALLVVAISAVANGLGLALGNVLAGRGGAVVGSLIGGIIQDVIGWVIFSLVMYLVGSMVFKAPTTYGRMLRSVGFAYAPGVLLVLRFVPILGGLIALVVGLWRLVATFIALREGLELDNGKTIATVLIGLLAYLVVLAIFVAIFAAVGLGAALVGGAF